MFCCQWLLAAWASATTPNNEQPTLRAAQHFHTRTLESIIADVEALTAHPTPANSSKRKLGVFKARRSRPQNQSLHNQTFPYFLLEE